MKIQIVLALVVISSSAHALSITSIFSEGSKGVDGIAPSGSQNKSYNAEVDGSANLAVSYGGSFLNSENAGPTALDIGAPGVYNYHLTLSGADFAPTPVPSFDFVSLRYFVVIFASPVGGYALSLQPYTLNSSSYTPVPGFGSFVFDNLRYELSAFSISTGGPDTISYFSFAPDGVPDYHGDMSITVSAVPEPAETAALVGLGLGAFAWLRRNRKTAVCGTVKMSGILELDSPDYHAD